MAQPLTNLEACRFCAARGQGSQLGLLESNQHSKVVGAFGVEGGEARRNQCGRSHHMVDLDQRRDGDAEPLHGSRRRPRWLKAQVELVG